jgi:NADH-quinone oxidoreductase subunit N
MNPLNLELGIGVLGLVLLLAETFSLISRKAVGYAALGGLVLALVLLVSGSCNCVPAYLSDFYVLDSAALFYKGLAIISTIAVLVISMEYAPVLSQFIAPDGAKNKDAGLGEFFCLPLFVCMGLMVMASAQDLITIFVSLELVTVSFYVLVAFMRRSAMSLEAGVKYLILGALSTGLLIYGLAWVYGITGQITLSGIEQKLVHWQGDNTALLFGAALVLAGLGFKVAAVPFQIWVPDVYQGAPTPITAFLSVGSKAAGFIVLTRIFGAFTAKGSVISDQVTHMILLIAGATILIGNLSAIGQKNFKRLLGYSSIAHAGYLLLALGCLHAAHTGIKSSDIVAFYLATYLPMTFICFLLLGVARAQGRTEEISSLAGIARKSPLLGFAATLALASLAGLPLTAGFMGKLFVFFAALNEGHYGLVLIAIIGAASGFYYYFKVILALHSKPENDAPAIKLAVLSQAMLILFMAAIIVIGVYPGIISRALGVATAVAIK